MVRDQIEAIEQRDQALLKLSDLTRACLFLATALLAAFSVIAAVTIPGQSQISANSSTNPGQTEDAPVSQVTGNGQLRPGTGSLRHTGGRPIAVSGGSH